MTGILVSAAREINGFGGRCACAVRAGETGGEQAKLAGWPVGDVGDWTPDLTQRSATAETAETQRMLVRSRRALRL